MSSKTKIENFLRYLFPFRLQSNKDIIQNFFKEIFRNFHSRSEFLFDTYTFQELIQIPMIVSDKLYFTFTSHQSKFLVMDEFANGLYELFFGDIDDKMSIVFDLLDFDGDGVITIEDCFLVLSHLHLIDNTTDTINLIEKIIASFFGHKTKIDKENCFNLHKNFDVLILVLLFLNKYINVISEAEIYHCELIWKKGKDKGGYMNYGDIITADEYDDLEYKPTPALFNYLDATEFGKKKKKNFEYEEDDSDSDLESDDEDLDALYDFSIDFQELRDRFINQCSYEPRLLTSTFSCSFFQEERTKMKEQQKVDTVKQLDDILMNQSYKRMRFKEKRKNENNVNNNANNHVAKNIIMKDSEVKNKNEDDTNSVGNMTRLNCSTNEDSKPMISGGGLRRAATNFFGVKRANTKMMNKCEIILCKEKEDKNTNKPVKFILVGRYLFYYKKISQKNNNFYFKKIFPISSLFLRKTKKDNIVHLTLVSYLHNIEKKKYYCCENNDEANKFYSKFNKAKMFRDIKKEYYFKFEVGAGKFGHVFLAQRNSDSKQLAVKLVQKGNQSIEEYKINRWEIGIFKMLQNIKHPNVIQCIDMFENECQIFFVYEYIPSGDLKKYARDLKLNPQFYTINTILKLSMQMIEGTKVLHRYGIIHRDIKTTNMMVTVNSPIKKSVVSYSNGFSEVQVTYTNLADATVKIIDFGLSRILGKFETSNDPYGSLCFKAPELIEHVAYDFKVDVWAIGVTIFYLVYRELPYEKGSKEDIKQNIMYEPVPFCLNNFINNITYYKDTSKLDKINSNETKSSLLYSLMKDCLEKNPHERPSIDELSEKYTPIIKSIVH